MVDPILENGDAQVTALPDFEEYIAGYGSRALHERKKPRRPGVWIPCEHPERPHDGYMQVDVRCRPCIVAVAAAAVMLPTRTREMAGVIATLAEIYEWAREYHGLPKLPERVR